MTQIEPENFPPNSHASKEKQKIEDLQEDKKPKKVVSTPVTKKQKSFAEKFTDTFFGDDAKSVGNYILYDVLIPAAKNTINEMISLGIERLLYGGESRSRSSRINRDGGSGRSSYISYSNYYDRDRRPLERDRGEIRSRSSRYRFDDIVIKDRREAEEVLDNLQETIRIYGVATVADFYDLIDYPSEHTDNKYGWDDLGRTVIERVREGYIILLPKPSVIE